LPEIDIHVHRSLVGSGRHHKANGKAGEPSFRDGRGMMCFYLVSVI